MNSDCACPRGLLLFLFAAACACAQTADSPDFFESKVRPVLANQCYACHGASALGGLRLDSRDAMLKGGKSGPALKPGDPESSLLIKAVRQTDPNLKMPMGGKLKDGEIESLVAWVKAGAVWPAGAAKTATAPAAGKYVIAAERRAFWSIQPLSHPEPPAVKDPRWAKTTIDKFILSRLEQEGLKPVKAANRRDLLRRAYFDLTGLPPTPEETAAFLQDASPDAFAKVVDRLLASPHYGERWGRFWLDVARFGEDDYRSLNPFPRGYRPYPNAHLYRDWVIQAFNDDLPYDAFVKAQLAGDLLDPKTRYKNLAATGFLGLGPWYYDNGSVEVTRADERHDRVDVVTRGFLGLTVACARCHDHKYDPIPQTDYYALAGVFLNTSYTEYPRVPKSVVDQYTKLEEEVEKKQKILQDMQQNFSAQLSESLAFKSSNYLQGVYEVVAQKKEMDTVVENRKLDYELLQRWVAYMGKPTDKYKFKEPWQAMMKRASGEGGGRGGRGGKEVDKMPPTATASAAQAKPGGPSDENQDPPSSQPETTPAPSPAMAGRRGGRGNGNADAKRLADEFQANVVRVMLARKELDEENQVIIAKSLEGTKKKKRANKPNEFVTNDDFCPNCALRLKNLPEDENNFWTEMFQRELKEAEDPAAMMAAGGRMGKPGVLLFRGWGLESRIGSEAQTQIAAVRNDIEEARKKLEPSYPFIHGVKDVEKPVDLPLAIRGNPENLGAEVPRHYLSLLSKAEPEPFRSGSGRLELADRIVKEPIAMRVIVNRVWKEHFGTGLVDTPSNFGQTGERPANPELLEYLASSFVKNGMSIKKLHREIMLSSVYQLSADNDETAAAKDSGNRLYWRWNRKRMEAEQLRDAVLKVAGNLDESLSGPSADLSPAFTRRTVYGKVSRYKLDEFLQIFDFPTPSISAEKRFTTTVPLQRLFLMNSDFMQYEAEELAKRVAPEPDNRARIRKAYQLIFDRDPSMAEIKAGLDYLHAEPMREFEEAKSAPPVAEKPEAPEAKPAAEGMMMGMGMMGGVGGPMGGRRGAGPASVATVKYEPTAWGRYIKVLFNSSEFLFIN